MKKAVGRGRQNQKGLEREVQTDLESQKEIEGRK